MLPLRLLLPWALALILLIAAGYGAYAVLFATPAESTSGLPGNGGFTQVPLGSPQQYTRDTGDWKFTMTARNAYTLAGKVVGRHEYPASLPDGIIALDLAVVNGDLLRKDILPYFRFTMGDRTLEYTYDVPAYTGLTEEYIDEHISNNHLVFLDPDLERKVKAAKTGDCLIIKGKLVDISGSSRGSGYNVRTSTVRNDTYPAGCEIILVEEYTPFSCGD